MRKSAKKRHTNNLWNDSLWFCRQCLRSFCYFLRKYQENGCLENYIRVRAFKHRLVSIDQVFCTRMFCLLQSWRFQLTALPGQTTKERKTHSRPSCVLSNTHTFALTQMRRCVQKPFVQRNSMTSSKKFVFHFSWKLLISCLLHS